MSNRVFAVNNGRNASNGGLQLFRAPGAALFTFTAGGSGAAHTNNIRIPIPDSRLRVKISVLWAGKKGTKGENPQTALSGTGTIWLYTSEEEYTGSGGEDVATDNIEGTAAAPTGIPTTDGLVGYSREFWTAADAIQGQIVAHQGILGGVPLEGSWILQCRYQPDTGQRFTEQEWQEVTAGASPRVLQNVIVD